MNVTGLAKKDTRQRRARRCATLTWHRLPPKSNSCWVSRHLKTYCADSARLGLCKRHGAKPPEFARHGRLRDLVQTENTAVRIVAEFILPPNFRPGPPSGIAKRKALRLAGHFGGFLAQPPVS